jgi:antitoxin HicB
VEEGAMVLLHGFIKETQKTPQREIDLAMKQRKATHEKKNIGSNFDSWLSEKGIREEVTATAIKRVLARQVEAAMKEKNFSKAEMARRMQTSRAALDRLLDPDYEAVTLSTLRKAADAVGRKLVMELR